MTLYSKTYTRENCLMAFQMWEEQFRLVTEKFGIPFPFTMFDAHNGVVSVYADASAWDSFATIIGEKSNADPKFVPATMAWYSEHLDKIEKIWHAKKLSSRKALIDLFDLAVWTWVGLSVSYVLPGLKGVSKKDQDLGMALRQRSADFLELTDHVMQDTLYDLYPKLGVLAKYITIEELKNNKLPSLAILKKRAKHYIYFGFKLYVDKDVFALAKKNGIEIEKDKIPTDIKELSGQIAMKGKVSGRVRILFQKSDIPSLKTGEILVTAMTTPDYLPAMHKAAAFITDEGGITCHAAIVAREIGKPCIIGTKIATQVLKTGDMVEVDANHGTVKIIKK